VKRRKRKKVVKKKKVEEVRVCWFCDGERGLERHHIIPVQIGGKNLPNNKVDICHKCHPKLHKLLDPVIEYLLIYIKRLQETEAPPQMRGIGFMKKNGWDKPKVFKNRYHRLKEGEK